MPTRFTAGALAINTRVNLSATGLYHSSSIFVNGKNLQEMARLLETPVTVTTIDHLCICLTGVKEDHHSIFFNLSHSCVVIDEVDFYDEFTQQNILVLLKVLRLLKVPVLVMSATLPNSSINLYELAGYTNLKIYSDTTEEGKIESQRARCTLVNRGMCTKPEDILDILERSLNGEPTIIYANTVRRAQEYYSWFKNQKCDIRVVLYHSRYCETDKKRKEEELYDLLGVEAWKNHSARGIAILTQIGELSVNISANLMISDLCPIDRLAQRVGRLCRFNRKIGELVLIEPAQYRDGEIKTYPAPYGRWMNKTKSWESSEPFLQSKELLLDGQYSADRFVELVNTIYPNIQKSSTRASENKRMLQNHIINNWLITPAEQMEDDGNTDRWSSRDIPPQKTVYGNCSRSSFDDGDGLIFKSWNDYNRFRLEHSIQCPVYLYKSAETDGKIVKQHAYIMSNSKDECSTEEIDVVDKAYYSFEFGLHLEDNFDD